TPAAVYQKRQGFSVQSSSLSSFSTAVKASLGSRAERVQWTKQRRRGWRSAPFFASARRGAPQKSAQRKRHERRPLPVAETGSAYHSSSLSSFSTAVKASLGRLTEPSWRIFFLPSFCFSSSFFLRVMSPP